MQHPYSHFGSGSKETLRTNVGKNAAKKVQSALRKFHKENFSANLMRLVVLSNQNLDELESMVREVQVEEGGQNKFSQLPSSNKTVLMWDPNLLRPQDVSVC